MVANQPISQFQRVDVEVMSTSANQPILALTAGDCAGIGPEIVAKALAHFPGETFHLFTHQALFERACCVAGIVCPSNVIWHPIDVEGDIGSIHPGKNQALTGEIAYRSVVAAAQAALRGEIAGIVTAPFSKAALHLAGHDVPGHTELLAQMCGREEATMAFLSPNLIISLVTIHCALSSVPALLTSERLHRVFTDTALAVQKLKRVARPKIGVLALNPHAGEEGAFGDEEYRCILPAMQAHQALADWVGPLVPDVAFRHNAFDATIAMYHDQGLIPFKMLAFDDGVNVTLGLPIVRTSPDHGTAFDIAWQGKASEASMVAAIEAAMRLCQ